MLDTMDTQAVPEQKEDDISTIHDRMAYYNKGCRDLLVDMQCLKFHATDDDMYLEYPGYVHPMYFKKDPNNPKDPKIMHAQKQFCRYIGVPHGFFMNNRPQLKEAMVSSWQTGLKAKKEPSMCAVRLRESDTYATIRAFLKATHTIVTTHEILKTIQKTISEKMSVDIVTGDEKDDLISHIRLLYEKKYELFGSDVCLGFSLITSDLGACPISVHVLLHDIKSKTSYIALYGGKPFFEMKQEGVQLTDIKQMYPKMINRISEESDEILDRIKKRVEDQDGMDLDIETEKFNSQPIKVPERFKRAIYHEVVQCKDEIKTPYDYARHACLVAKDFDPMKRIKIEQAAGMYLNLVFPRT